MIFVISIRRHHDGRTSGRSRRRKIRIDSIIDYLNLLVVVDGKGGLLLLLLCSSGSSSIALKTIIIQSVFPSWIHGLCLLYLSNTPKAAGGHMLYIGPVWIEEVL